MAVGFRRCAPVPCVGGMPSPAATILPIRVYPNGKMGPKVGALEGLRRVNGECARWIAGFWGVVRELTSTAGWEVPISDEFFLYRQPRCSLFAIAGTLIVCQPQPFHGGVP
jgi:hypothetical protein